MYEYRQMTDNTLCVLDARMDERDELLACSGSETKALDHINVPLNMAYGALIAIIFGKCSETQ